MTMQTDVKAKYLTTTGNVGLDGRMRVRSIYYVPSSAGGNGSVSFRDGSATSTELLRFDVVANGGVPRFIWIPGEGILFQNDPYVTLVSIVSLTFFYG